MLTLERIGLRFKYLIEQLLLPRSGSDCDQTRPSPLIKLPEQPIGIPAIPTSNRETQSASDDGRTPLISVIITAHNEGAEVRQTIESIRTNTHQPHEIIIVDDASTGGSCDGLDAENVRVIRHEQRIGVAYSRNVGCAAATGNVFAFLDGHQRLSDGCLDQCAQLAAARSAIVWPDVRGLTDANWTGHGADFQLCPKRGYFQAKWRRRAPHEQITQITSLIVPGYVMPRKVYEQVRWIDALRGWGGSEAAITLKAYFLGIEMLHLCGPLARHLFRSSIPYSVPWEAVWRNQAIIARVCFDDRSWFDYWLPNVFEKHLTDAVRRDLESEGVLAEHEAFLAEKVRTDRDFWQMLLGQQEPFGVRTQSG